MSAKACIAVPDGTHFHVRGGSVVLSQTTSDGSYFSQRPKGSDDQRHLKIKRCLTPTGETIKRSKRRNDTLISKQSTLRQHCWRIVDINGETSLCMVEVIPQRVNELATIKILDSRIPVHQWKRYQVDPEHLSRPFIHTSESLDELICNLKRSKILHSTQLETALRIVDRVHFCPKTPYHDCAVDIGDPAHEVCISSPHMHVWATELLINHLPQAQYCLDVGSGSGYFTALMAYLAPDAFVYGVDAHSDLIHTSRDVLEQHYPTLSNRIALYAGNGEMGVNDNILFQAIHVGFMCLAPPEALVNQLAPGGRMLVPVANGKPSFFDKRCLGGFYTCVDKDKNGHVSMTKLFSCSFVPSIALLQPEGNL